MKMRLRDIIENQRKQRYQALIFTRKLDFYGRNIIEKLFNNYEIDYIDILNEFKIGNLESREIHNYNCDKLKDYFWAKEYISDLIVIDNLESILSTYDVSELNKFIKYFEKDRFKPLFENKVFIFILPELNKFESLETLNNDNKINRIIKIDEIIIN